MSLRLDAHAQPPEAIRNVHKRYQKSNVSSICSDEHIIDTRLLGEDDLVYALERHSFANLPPGLREIFASFTSSPMSPRDQSAVYGVKGIPGLYIYPRLLPQEVQLHMLSKLFCRDLSNTQHQTNVHMHYHVPCPEAGTCYFDISASKLAFVPKDPAVHKPVTTEEFLNKKLRWVTLGGQYDWTRKVYPDGPPPPFPTDIKNLVESLFPMKAEAAIVNLYSPGDTLSLHRDVSEECDQPLASISMGCDAIFVIGLDAANTDSPPRIAAVRLRSGDAVLMSGESRYAWHSVPKVLEGTCPEWMQDWPVAEHEAWKGWIKSKRTNLNVRQMFDS